MASTALISDLHLGSGSRGDVLRREPVLERLLDATSDVDHLVLLGDVIELRDLPLGESLTASQPFFEAIGKAFAGRRVTLVPGNHDHRLLGPWLERSREENRPAELDEVVDAPHPAVRSIQGWLGDADFEVRYPGIWVRDDVYATHGHYLDRHTTVPTFERLSAGVMGRVVGGLPEQDAGPDDYEAALAPIYAWSYSLAQHADERATGTQGVSLRVWRTLAGDGHRPLRRRALAALFPLGIVALNRAGIGPVRADITGTALARAGVRAMGEVVERLQIPAQHVIFGHTHRAGPQRYDDLADWTTPSGVRLHNCGCWVYERHFLGETPYESPYWPGVAIRVGADGPPEHVRLLGDRGHAQLSAPAATPSPV